MTVSVARILDKLERVRLGGIHAFGSEKHQYLLNPPVSEELVGEFEAREAVRLPSGYREFLLQAGNGGAGPYYGLLKLDDWRAASQDEAPGSLARSCALRPEISAGQRGDTSSGDLSGDNLDGTLTIVDQGCTFYVLLIVTGEYRGRVVYVDLQGSHLPYFVHDPDFLSWYERWLDELLWGYDDFWYGLGLPGREEQLADVLCDRHDSPDFVCEAMTTLGRIPRLQSRTLAILRSLLRHSGYAVRGQAAFLLGKNLAVGAVDDVKGLLMDESDQVRKRALEALARFPGVEWEPMARAALNTETPELALKAMFLLKNAGFLHSEDVKILAASRNPEIHRYGEWAARELKSSG
jgi:hypothetical protein